MLRRICETNRPALLVRQRCCRCCLGCLSLVCEVRTCTAASLLACSLCDERKPAAMQLSTCSYPYTLVGHGADDDDAMAQLVT
jgi:hypothetical protein